MRVLTVHQPWAGLLVDGIKDVENRGWKTNYRGPLLIHAGAATDPYYGRSSLPPNCAVQRAIVGVVTLFDCVYGYTSAWAEPGQWHWLVGNARAFRHPIPATGRLGLWTPDREVASALPLYARE
jgi:hypothetical protein